MPAHTPLPDPTCHAVPDDSVPQRAACESNTCSRGVCPPCLLVWGLAGAVLLVNVLLEWLK